MMAHAARRELEELLGERARFDAPLSRYTSLRVGGPAAALVTPRDRAELARVLATCTKHRLRHTVLGAGFNTLFRDGAFEGVVIQLGRLRRLEARPGGGLRAEAGVSHSQITNFCIQHGLAGLEFGAGVPGSVGGWLAMNAGLPGREMKDVAGEIEVMSPTGQHVKHLGRDSVHFVYRALRGLAPGSLILSVLFAVSISSPAKVKAEVEGWLAKRADTQPLDVPSCGSVFKNPRGDYAGRLIEAAGLKGLRIGGAQISPVHANFIANVGQARASDVLALIEEAQRAVRAQSGRRLEPEVRIVGSPV